jgi:hypothetical protein
MWATFFFLKLLFFIPGPFQGGIFFGEIIYFSALDLKPASLNLRPAPWQLSPPVHETRTTARTGV